MRNMPKAAAYLVVVLLVLGTALKAHAMPEAMGAPLACAACCAVATGEADDGEALGKPAGAWSAGVIRSSAARFPEATPRFSLIASERAFSPALTRLLL